MANPTTPNCPKCGAPMKKRNGQYGEFWGCSRYPGCRGTRNLTAAERDVAAVSNTPVFTPAADNKTFNPSPYQQAVFAAIKDPNGGNLFIAAVAGSGKTTTIVKALELVPSDKSVLFLAFNVHIKDELKRRAPAHVNVSTFHGLGMGMLRKALPVAPTVDDRKLDGIAKELMPGEADAQLRVAMLSLVGLVKNTLASTSEEDLDHLVDRYSVDFAQEDRSRLYQAVATALRMDLERTVVIDFDDMVWYPTALKLAPTQYDYIFVDEVQDLNRAQIAMLLMSIKKTGRVIAVGDKNQSIYGFRGADTTAVSSLVSALNAKQLPLSVTYRCPTSHVQLAQAIVPEIQAAPGAKAGHTAGIKHVQFLQAIKDGDLMLCRCNAPLVSAAYALIKMGKKVVLRGRDFGKSLIVFVDKFQAKDMSDLMAKLNAHRDMESARLGMLGRDSQMQAMQDKCDCIEALSEGCANLTELRARITSIFDDDTKTGIVGASVHRAKGDEANCVWILRPELMPHPMAKKDWEAEQEMNLKYVAYTRSKGELWFVETEK